MQPISKKIIPGTIELDLLKRAIVVSYETVVIYADDDGQQKKQSKAGKKVFPISPFRQADIPSIVDELVGNCTLFNQNNRDLLQCLLEALLENRDVGFGGEVSIAKLDRYMECFYDELPIKIEATHRIFKLCENPNNLPVLASNTVLTSALTRSLCEDGSKSIVFATNICFIFFAISHYSAYGQLLLKHRISDALMRVVDQEERRYKAWCSRLSELKGEVTKASAAEKETLKHKYLEQYEKFKRMLQLQDRLLFAAMHTIVNLSEAASEANVEATHILEVRRTIDKLAVFLKRRPINQPLIALTAVYLRRLSATAEGTDLILNTSIPAGIIRLVQDDQAGVVFEPLVRLMYNLSFDSRASRLLLESGILSSIQEHLLRFTRQLMTLVAPGLADDNFGEPTVEDLCRIVEEHQGRAENGTLDNLTSLIAVTARFLYLFSAEPMQLELFESTMIGKICIWLACLLLNPPLELVSLLVNLLISPAIAIPITTNGLLLPLARQAVRLNEPVLFLMFSNAAIHYPTFQKRHIADRSFAHIPVLIDVMMKHDDSPDYIFGLLGAVATAPLKYLAQNPNVLRFIMGLIIQPDASEALRLEAITMLSNLFTSKTVIINPQHVSKLPDTLLTLLGKLDSELDYQGALLLCILKGIAHDDIRAAFMSIPDFIPAILRFLYTSDEVVQIPTLNAPRSQSASRTGGRRDTTLVVKSTASTFEARAASICSTLSALICDAIAAAEQDQAEKLQKLKFQRYNRALISALQ